MNLLNKKVPNFEQEATNDKTVSSSNIKGKNTVLFFYPKDNTPGCTLEGQDFRDSYPESEIYRISRESIKSHENFKNKQSFPFELISDPDELMCKAFDVMKLKSMYGREYMGIERSTFLVNAEGVIVSEWRKVKVKGHVEEVLEKVKSIQ